MQFAVASASALFLASTVLAAPSPITKRDTIATQDTSFKAPIYLRSKKSDSVFAPRFAAFNGNRESDNGHQYLVMQTADGNRLASEDFKFVSVTGNVLDNKHDMYKTCYPIGDTGGESCLGFLQSVSNPDFCVGAHKLRQQTRFDALPCPHEDSSAIYPFLFELTSFLYNTTSNGMNSVPHYHTTLDFKGDSKRSDGTRPYSLIPGTTETLNLLAVYNQKSDYDLRMGPKFNGDYPTSS